MPPYPPAHTKSYIFGTRLLRASLNTKGEHHQVGTTLKKVCEEVVVLEKKQTNPPSFSLDLLKCCFTFTETGGLLGTGTQDSHFEFYIAPKL